MLYVLLEGDYTSINLGFLETDGDGPDGLEESNPGLNTSSHGSKQEMCSALCQMLCLSIHLKSPSLSSPLL